jgi:hypothetical protein
MKVKIIVDRKRVFYLDDAKELKEISSYSWEGFSSFTAKYDEEENLLVVEYGAECPWLCVNGKEVKLF